MAHELNARIVDTVRRDGYLPLAQQTRSATSRPDVTRYALVEGRKVELLLAAIGVKIPRTELLVGLPERLLRPLVPLGHEVERSDDVARPMCTEPLDALIKVPRRIRIDRHHHRRIRLILKDRLQFRNERFSSALSVGKRAMAVMR